MGTIFKYLNTLLKPFNWINLPHIEKLINDLNSSSFPIGCHAPKREHASCNRPVGDNGQLV